jgi:TRAP-type C4-dicarboxylate transport system permease small subunit
LWSLYADGTVGLGGGVSAMPSMHVSMAFLFVLLGWRVNRLLGIGALVFCTAIEVASVHLGWHYAIDGYASVALTGLIWWAVGRALDWRAGVQPR